MPSVSLSLSRARLGLGGGGGGRVRKDRTSCRFCYKIGVLGRERCGLSDMAGRAGADPFLVDRMTGTNTE